MVGRPAYNQNIAGSIPASPADVSMCPWASPEPHLACGGYRLVPVFHQCVNVCLNRTVTLKQLGPSRKVENGYVRIRHLPDGVCVFLGCGSSADPRGGDVGVFLHL